MTWHLLGAHNYFSPISFFSGFTCFLREFPKSKSKKLEHHTAYMPPGLKFLCPGAVCHQFWPRLRLVRDKESQCALCGGPPAPFTQEPNFQGASKTGNAAGLKSSVWIEPRLRGP